MTTRSRIEWTEHTWNPVVGCTKISPGCKHCYAEVMSRRLRAMGAAGYEAGLRPVRTLHARLEEPLRRRMPPTYFVNSMSDLFHDRVPTAFIDDVFDVMRRAEQHSFQVLTKRAERMAAYSLDVSVPRNVWLGVSVENRRHGVPRIEWLRRARATTRFLSVEPLLENLGPLDLTSIDWVIVGGESGRGARPMNEEWVRSLRDQCEVGMLPFLFKQWGSGSRFRDKHGDIWTYGADGLMHAPETAPFSREHVERKWGPLRALDKKAAGRELDGRTWDEFPAAVSA